MIFKQEYALPLINLLILLYSAQVAPVLNPTVSNALQHNTWVKILLIALVVGVAINNFLTGLLLAVALVMTINLTAGRGILESFYSVKYFGDRLGKVPIDANSQPNPQQLLEMRTDVYPNCDKITMNDIYNAFKIENIDKQPYLNYSIKELMKQDKTVDPKQRFLNFMNYMVEPRPAYYDAITDDDAGRIATFLTEYGFTITAGKCEMGGQYSGAPLC